MDVADWPERPAGATFDEVACSLANAEVRVVCCRDDGITCGLALR